MLANTYHPLGGAFEEELAWVGLLSLIESDDCACGPPVGALAAFDVLVVKVDDVDPPGACPALT